MKAIIIKSDGEQIEFKNFLLYGITEEGCVVANNIDNMQFAHASLKIKVMAEEREREEYQETKAANSMREDKDNIDKDPATNNDPCDKCVGEESGPRN